MRWLFTLALLALVGLSGCGNAGTYYSVVESHDQVTVTLHNTKVGNIEVQPIDTGGSGSGSGTRSGNRSTGGEKTSYDIKFEFRDGQINFTSVTVDGQEIPKSPG